MPLRFRSLLGPCSVGGLLWLVGCASANGAWRNAREIDRVAEYREFIQKYPQSEFVPAAQKRIAELEEEHAAHLKALSARLSNYIVGQTTLQDVMKDMPNPWQFFGLSSVKTTPAQGDEAVRSGAPSTILFELTLGYAGEVWAVLVFKEAGPEGAVLSEIRPTR